MIMQRQVLQSCTDPVPRRRGVPQLQFIDRRCAQRQVPKGSSSCWTRWCRPWLCNDRFRCMLVQYIEKVVDVSVGALWRLLEEFPFYVARTVHLDLGTCTPCSDKHMPLCICVSQRKLSDEFVHFLREKWTRSSRRSSHMEIQELLPRAVSGSHSAVRGASTPLWGVESCSLPSWWPNPIPAIPPCVVRTPRLHGAQTTEETFVVKLGNTCWQFVFYGLFRAPSKWTLSPCIAQFISATCGCAHLAFSARVRNKSNNSGNTQHLATTATTVPTSCVPERTLSRIDARACAQKKSTNSTGNRCSRRQQQARGRARSRRTGPAEAGQSRALQSNGQ